MTIEIYTDGGCSPNPGPGGWGAVIITASGSEMELSGGARDTTNNRMELTAVISALQMTEENDEPIVVTTDSQYVKNGMTSWIHGWKKRGWRTSAGGAVLNRELWQELDTLCGKRKVTFEWIRGHQGHPMNERADRLSHHNRPAL